MQRSLMHLNKEDSLVKKKYIKKSILLYSIG